MMDEKYMPLALAYIEGELSSEERTELQHLIAGGKIEEKELQELALFYGKLPVADEIKVPAEQMRNRFYTALAKEEQKLSQPGWPQQIADWWQNIRFGTEMRLAFSFCMLLLGIGIGYLLRPASSPDNQQLSKLAIEVQQMREMVILSMLEQSSSAERLKAVNMGYELQEADVRVIEALLRTLNSDPNVNVRLAAVEALRKHADKAVVREGLLASINRQDAPQVQIALADLMVALQEKQAVEPMQKLLQEQGVNETVRQKIENSIHVLI
jgi:hypothetical protein